MGDDIVEVHTENESSKNKIGPHDEKWLEESKAKLLKQNHGEKRANIIMPWTKKQLNKNCLISPIQIRKLSNLFLCLNE